MQATWTGYQLPAAIFDGAAVALDGQLIVAGWTRTRGAPIRLALRLDPVTGRTWPARGLAAPLAGAAAALLRGRAIAVGRAAHGAVRYSAAPRLAVPVSFPGTVRTGARLWVFGGITASGLTNLIQLVDLRTGRARIVGTLPRPLAAMSAFTLHGIIYLAGGEAPRPMAPARSPWSAWPGHAPAGLALRAATLGVTTMGGMLASQDVTASAEVLRYDPATGRTTLAGLLPLPVAHAASAVAGSTAYLVGGTDGARATPAVVALRLVPASTAVPTAASGAGEAPWLAAPSGRGHLRRGSKPSALPADVLVADHGNNRLVVIDPQGRVRWQFPRPGDLTAGQTFVAPDDAFFSPDGRYIVATQEDDQVISVIEVATHRIIYRYGKPGTPGAGPDRVSNPDDAMLLPGGDLIAADIRNCRVIVVSPPDHRPRVVVGRGPCWHDPPRHFGSPNGAFPVTGGGYVVTEINGDWADGISERGRLLWSANPPGVSYPSDTNEVYPGRLLTADYSDPGQVVEFTPGGRLLWRFGGLNQPSLALSMPNGDIVVNDDFNDRVIVIDPAAHRIVWQYGHTGVPGTAPGYLNDPDGLDLVPPDSMLIRYATTTRQARWRHRAAGPRGPGPHGACDVRGPAGIFQGEWREVRACVVTTGNLARQR